MKVDKRMEERRYRRGLLHARIGRPPSELSENYLKGYAEGNRDAKDGWECTKCHSRYCKCTPM